MTREEWEQDIRNRQRNIVFPDTMLNEGRFYRNIAYGKGPLPGVQKVGVAILVLGGLASTAVVFAYAIAEWRDGGFHWLVAMFWVAFGILGLALSWRLALRMLVSGTDPAVGQEKNETIMDDPKS